MRGKSFYILIALLLLTVGCKKDDPTPAADPTLNATSSINDKEGNSYTVGYTNGSGNNKNPYVSKKNNKGEEVWKIVHETSDADGTATLITLDEDQNPWVVFTIDGGSTNAGYITKKEIEGGAFDNILFNNYGNGGGAKIAIIARLNPLTGKIVKGTFFMCRVNKSASDNDYGFSGKSINDPNTKTNSITINQIGVKGEIVTIEANNASYPPALESTQGKFVYYPNYKSVGTGHIRYKFPVSLVSISVVDLLPKQ